jgi:hypothetical protein
VLAIAAVQVIGTVVPVGVPVEPEGVANVPAVAAAFPTPVVFHVADACPGVTATTAATPSGMSRRRMNMRTFRLRVVTAGRGIVESC